MNALERQMVAELAVPTKQQAARAALSTIALTKIERRICEVLVQHLGSWVPHERIIASVYQNDSDGGPESARNSISVAAMRIPDKVAQHGFRLESHNSSGRKLTFDPSKAPVDSPSIVPAAPAPEAAIVKHVPRELRDGEIELGRAANGDPIGLHLGKLIEGRLLIQGNSGAGKSMLLRRIFERAFGLIQQVLVDPDGEFSTLAEKFDVAIISSAEIIRVGGHALAHHLRQHRYSAVLDLSDATSEQRLQAVADLATGLIEIGSEHWHPILVEVDEAQTLAPHYDTGDVEADTRKRAIAALADMMGRGRKRGVAGVIATQRLAETSKAVVAKATNIIVGQTVLDIDQERAGALIGFTAGSARALRSLAAGEFLALGPALAGPTRVRFRSGQTDSRHKGETPAVAAPPPVSAATAADLLRAVPDAAPIEDGDQGQIYVRRPGRRGPDMGWKPNEDQTIRDGYKNQLPLAAICEQLAEVGRHTVVSSISTRAKALGFGHPARTAGWTDAEDVILRDGYTAELKINDIVTKLAESGFSRGRVAVQMRAIALGITRDRVNYWTEEESAIALKGLNDGKSTREIIVALKAAGYERGVTGITKFAQKHGISRNSAVPWTDEDVATLREMYGENKSIAEIMKALDRSRGAIQSMASQLGIKQREPWTDAEKAILRKAHADGVKMVDVPALLPGRTYATVARMAGQLRLDFKGRTKRGEGPIAQGLRPAHKAKKARRK